MPCLIPSRVLFVSSMHVTTTIRRSLAFSIAAASLLGLCATQRSAAAEQAGSPEVSSQVLNFALIDHQGRLHELRRLGGKAVVLYFTANDCPVARQSARKIKALQEKFADRGVSVFMVNSCMADDRKSISAEAAELHVWHVPVLKDETQGAAKHL